MALTYADTIGHRGNRVGTWGFHHLAISAGTGTAMRDLGYNDRVPP
jgi:hypothetical protein